MNEIDRQLKRLFQVARQQVSREREESPFGFARQLACRWQLNPEASSQPAPWMLFSRWSLAGACLLLIISLVFNLGLVRFEWSPEMTVADPVSRMILLP